MKWELERRSFVDFQAREQGVRDLIACRNALLDALMTAVSVGLQVGVPLRAFADKFKRTRFSPSGFTGDAEVPRASSILDYVFARLSRWYDPPAAEGEGAEAVVPTPLATTGEVDAAAAAAGGEATPA